MKIIKRALPIIILFAVILYTLSGNTDQDQSTENKGYTHVFDKAGIINAPDVPRFEWLLDLIEKESDLDIKFLFVKTIGNNPIEQVAVNKMDKYGIGRDSGKERGILFLYVMDKKKLKIEVGYGLEGYFPDIFIGYLIRNQADAFFEASNPSLGLRLLIRILQHRIREAALHRDYNPSILEGRIKSTHLSGGAGASAKVGRQKENHPFKHGLYNEEAKAHFVATTTVDGTFNNYIDWLYGGKYDPNVDLFTNQSLAVLNRFPMTPAYYDYILLMYAGKKYKVIKRGNLALLYFTDDPLVSPLFFNRIHGKWRINIAAEIRDTRNHVGGVYTWSFNPDSKDEFVKTFQDLIINIRGYYRIKNGDNTELPVKVDIQKKS